MEFSVCFKWTIFGTILYLSLLYDSDCLSEKTVDAEKGGNGKSYEAITKIYESKSGNDTDEKTRSKTKLKPNAHEMKELSTSNSIGHSTLKRTLNGSLERNDTFEDTYLKTIFNFQHSYKAVTQTLYVVFAGMVIVMIYFVIRMVRSRRRKNKSRKYGLITASGSEVEMQPLDKSDDDEEDAVLFDVHHKTIYNLN
ncbi:membrane protein FAM174B-like [Limulus polyphemus]|uniref:Membrane protein FAM174B-like n=1 Tax=Limulus polyphemus TaxID=6850 RepID=A0ABM1T188_LIMPO|nr:membrane protein FAM174B-like [Limulus polyphemus]XP_022249644.1 membrane protein FAM174B-like [Limulus polyphemus]XP_022249645.1 membrane protein FAM174B-like [Limulus polyphemus]XP_022249646.1 membrane protein FAM174B-like [Limulus polyphemus]